MNAYGKTVDTTYLSLESARERGFIHRDYIAHVLRWSHVAKWLMESKRYDKVRILDVGCGKELPLPMMLYSMKMSPVKYYGVDAGKVRDDVYESLTKTGKFQADIFEETDICNVTLKDLDDTKPDVVTCFEVLEHVEPAHMVRMLKKIRELMNPNGTFFLSTPCWNRVDCAGNHVNEMLFETLGSVLESVGFSILGVWGTFASIRDYEGILQASHPEWHRLFNRLREYYDTNFLSCIFAPIFPANSRNCLWQVCPKIPASRTTPSLSEIQPPWSSSTRWEDFKLATL